MKETNCTFFPGNILTYDMVQKMEQLDTHILSQCALTFMELVISTLDLLSKSFAQVIDLFFSRLFAHFSKFVSYLACFLR